MNNTMIIDGYRAVIQYDIDIEMFRGEFTGLNGGADFYADSVAKLREEGKISLRTFLDECHQRGIKPTKTYSGKFQVRLPEDLHKHAVDAATAKGQSLNQFVATAIEHELSA
ncbi:type II toxin-antitoxin system HicB family antitoxin [Vreelandella boliviensis]|uniref:type II toxin-antitoxin system HicB family antitoxin n=1 Tax=Vreelandella boliviensis TaxID=223527 RepID=UPI001B8BA705|nr:type II toxin-antitoxin system HicB family antitoxin [Halomonas boliviensis]MBS3668917.1 type II toxin-antitoxin system HicB family antitoxin [Halomonas boliviensis]